MKQASIGVLIIRAGMWYGPNLLRSCRLIRSVLPRIVNVCSLQHRQVLNRAGSVPSTVALRARVTAVMPIGLNYIHGLPMLGLWGSVTWSMLLARLMVCLVGRLWMVVLIRLLSFGMHMNRLVLPASILVVVTCLIRMLLLFIRLVSYVDGKLIVVICSVGGTLVDVAGPVLLVILWAYLVSVMVVSRYVNRGAGSTFGWWCVALSC